MADFLPGFYCIVSEIVKLKIIIYEKDKQGQNGNISNDIVRSFFATNIKGAG